MPVDEGNGVRKKVNKQQWGGLKTVYLTSSPTQGGRLKQVTWMILSELRADCFINAENAKLLSPHLGEEW